ncbi:MAG: hypothetical protein KF687_02335 [Cyclobacteriaceae bacterium]|nr:hypothetical protein [Cyclobacteriaceae bacterium]
MKFSKALTILFFLGGIFCWDVAIAQDDRMPDLDSGNGVKEQRFDPTTDFLPEAELKNQKTVIIPRDTVAALKPSVKKPDPKAKPEENASVLSFNFLYYLIERFKLSDIVD